MPKGIFIGLGGTGVTTVARLKALLFQRAYNSNKTAMDADCTFIFYDTDPGAKNLALKDVELQGMMGEYPIVDQGREFVDASATPPYNLYQEAKNASVADADAQRFLEWAIDPDVDGHFKLPMKELREGAGAQRMAGRTGFYYKSPRLENMIQTGLNSMKQLVNQGKNLQMEHPIIWVFSSCNGGTGSSALMDVLYLVDRMYKTHVSDGNDPYLRLILYMPKVFIDSNIKNALNYGEGAYATLWELNEFRVDALNHNDGKKFGAFAARPDKKGWTKKPWPVCSYVMGVDVESQESGSVTKEQMYANTAELCYFLHTGSAGTSMVSALDNDLSVNAAYANPLHVKDDLFDWAKFVVGSGYKAITKADEALKNYVRTRLCYDLFGYGLMGHRMEQLLPNTDECKIAAKEFASNYILSHLVNIDKFTSSPQGSLYKRYMDRFATINIPLETPEKEEWPNTGASFVEDCKKLTKKLQSTFEDPTQTYSMQWWISQIENSVKEGVDKSVIDHGLNYTYSLLDMVDDKYCEEYVIGKLKSKMNLKSLEDAIDAIIANNRPKKGFKELVPKMTEYRDACIKELAVNHIEAIIKNLTHDKSGLLEYMRRGDRDHIGINGLIAAFNSRFGIYKKHYQDLASDFKKTETEVCSDYFPKISSFVINSETWMRNNLFEQKYSSIVPLDTSETALCFESEGLGCPPMRNSDDGRGLASILSNIKARVPNQPYLFADLVMSNPQTQFNDLCKMFYKSIDEFIDASLNDNNNEVKKWLDMPLDQFFTNYFIKDGAPDLVAQNEYINKFNSSIPVFYPERSGSHGSVTERTIYVGASQNMANLLGFSAADPNMQYLPDNKIGNRFLVCKLKVGHNFYDYRYFDMIKNYYDSDRLKIEEEGSGCHIHKAFIKRDIKKAYNKVISKRFDDFLRLCWLDSYFEFLNAHGQTKDIVEAIFGTAKPQDDWDAVDSPKKPSKKIVDEWDIDDDLATPTDDFDDLDLNTLEEDSINLDDLDDAEASENYDVEEDVELGYRSIIEIENNGGFVVRINKLKKSAAGLIGFSSETPHEINFRATNLVGIRKEIINGFEVDYTNEFFKLLSDKFTGSEIGLTNEMRQKLVKVHSRYREEVFNVFKQKINLFLRASKHKSDRGDSLVFKMLQKTIESLKGKDIFK